MQSTTTPPTVSPCRTGRRIKQRLTPRQLTAAQMSHSDRAKVYRRRHLERATQLATTVATLHTDIQQLELETQALRTLETCGLHCSSVPRARMLTQLHAFLRRPRVELPGFATSSIAPTRVTAYGTSTTTVVHIDMELYGRYPSASLETIYSSILGNSVLLDTLMHNHVRYPCVVRYFFAHDGACERLTVDVDWFAGLSTCVKRLDDVVKIIGPLQRLGRPTVAGAWTL